MTKDEALRLALEALEDACGNRCNAEYNPCFQRDAITAIKEALAEQDSKDKEQAKTDSFVRQLDEALAQPEQEPVTVPENKKLILVDSSFDDLMYWLERCESKGHLENCSDLIEPWEKFCDSYCVWTDHHPDCKLAEQKPVAWLIDDDYTTVFHDIAEVHRRKGANVLPLYTTPPPVAEPHKRPSRSDIKPLTDEQIEDLCWTEVDQRLRSFARAIEAAHGIKGEA